MAVGLTNLTFTVKKSREAKKGVEVDFLVDFGAIYSLAPAMLLKKMGISAYKTLSFSLADGTKITRKVGDAYFECRGEGGAAPVIFGEKNDQPLLGATTLESIGLVLNPFNRELYPMRLPLGHLKQAEVL